jgi:LPXTG-motif cell wall-anchored protein
MSAKKFFVGAAIVATGLAGGAVAASDYPPDVPPQSTVLTSTQGSVPSSSLDGGTAGLQRPGQLPETGSDSGTLIKIAGGAVVAGAGLLVVTRRRRHPAPS